MSRRRMTRRARRLQVTFWRQGEPHPFPGYTTNLSTTGMFVGTASPQPKGARVRVEIHDRGRGFVIEGVVAHARKVGGDLGRITQSGMGVRFLTVEDLVRELLPDLREETEEIPQAAPPVPEAASAAPAEPRGEPVFAVAVSDPRKLVEIYDRDLASGGLFVPTPEPAKLREVVAIELRPPEEGAAPLRFRARVVQRFEGKGMGVELLDAAAVCRELRPLVERLRDPAPP